ncbi:TetR family transcriptional regulator [bacterium]|nr:TetR family transcriptional regulator [bacterium]
MARRNDHQPEQLREMAIEAAQRLLTEKGAKALSMRNVAKEIGYTVGTLYHLFQDRDDLLAQVQLHTLSLLHEKLATAAIAGKPPREALFTLAQTMLGFIAQYPGLWQAWMEFRPKPGLTLPEAYQPLLASIFVPFEQVLMPILGNDPERAGVAARVLWSGIYGIGHLSQGHKLGLKGASQVAEMIVSLIDAYLAGLLQKAAR